MDRSLDNYAEYEGLGAYDDMDIKHFRLHPWLVWLHKDYDPDEEWKSARDAYSGEADYKDV